MFLLLVQFSHGSPVLFVLLASHEIFVLLALLHNLLVAQLLLFLGLVSHLDVLVLAHHKLVVGAAHQVSCVHLLDNLFGQMQSTILELSNRLLMPVNTTV